MTINGLDLWIRPDEQCVALTRDYRLVQRFKGHRYSVDDMLVAHLACTTVTKPIRVLDLGCGIGSVLLMVAWAHPNAEFVGVEARAEHAALARRNVVLNGCGARVQVVEGDIRDSRVLGALGTFDLVTGTPPYFNPSRATICTDQDRAHAQFELRGGIEDYARAAAATIAPAGVFVTCASALPGRRALDALAMAGLYPTWIRQVEPRPGKPPFLTLLVASRDAVGTRREAIPPLLLRNADGTRAKEHLAIRQWFGFQCGQW